MHNALRLVGWWLVLKFATAHFVDAVTPKDGKPQADHSSAAAPVYGWLGHHTPATTVQPKGSLFELVKNPKGHGSLQTPPPKTAQNATKSSIFSQWFGGSSKGQFNSTTTTPSPQMTSGQKKHGWFPWWDSRTNNTLTSTKLPSTKSPVASSTSPVVGSPVGENVATEIPPTNDTFKDESTAFAACLDKCSQNILKVGGVLTLENTHALPPQVAENFVNCADKCMKKHLKNPTANIKPDGKPIETFRQQVLEVIYAIGHSWTFVVCLVIALFSGFVWLLGYGEKFMDIPNLIWSRVYTPDPERPLGVVMRQNFEAFLYRAGQFGVYILSAQYIPDNVAQYIPWSDAAARIQAQGRSAWMEHANAAQHNQDVELGNASFSRMPYEDASQQGRRDSTRSQGGGNAAAAKAPKGRNNNSSFQKPAASSTTNASEGVPLLRKGENEPSRVRSDIG